MTERSQQKTVLITGAAGGLGLCAVRRLAADGWKVFAADIKRAEDIENVIWVECDVTSEASVASAYADVLKHTGENGIDAIIHLAGIYVMDSLVEVEDDVMRRIVDVNLLGVYRVNRTFIPSILSSRGRIIIVTSELAPLRPLPFNGIYSITKTALDCYAHSLTMELILHDVRVITVRPGAFGTGMINASLASMERMSKKSKLYKNNAARYEKIMRYETGKARDVDVFAAKISKILSKRKPRYKYAIGNSFALRLVSALPTSVQAAIFSRLLG